MKNGIAVTKRKTFRRRVKGWKVNKQMVVDDSASLDG
jgi:hypothetical protein